MPKLLVAAHPPFAPVIRQLVKVGWEIICINPQFAKQLRDLNLENIKALGEFNTPEIHQEALNQAAFFTQATFSPIDTRGLHGKVGAWLEGDYRGLMYSKLFDLIHFVELMHFVEPDVILVHNDVEPLTRAAAEWGKAHEVSCVHVPHAVYHNIDNTGYDLHNIITASHILTSGRYQTEWYQKRGVGEAIIGETGLPQFDEWSIKQDFNSQWGRSLFKGLRQDLPVICYASSWRQNTNLTGMHDGVEETYMAILDCIVKLHGKVQFIIKCHPRGNNIGWHEKKAIEARDKAGIKPGTFAEVVDSGLEACLQASDLLFAYGPSNVLLEGSFVPWLRLACTSGYSKSAEVVKIATDPPNVDMMIMTFGAMLSSPPANYAGFREYYMGRCDGMNSVRIAQFIAQLAAEKEAVIEPELVKV